jgi:diadenosine tetraphosphate (Ap4A) HIT family hydrolase
VEKIFNGPDHIEWASVPWTDVYREDFHVIVYKDKYPVTDGHLLFVPVYNTIGVLKDAFEDAIREGKRMVEAGECEGFNIGINQGEVAGQTINWPHIHLIPRRKDDVEDPTGGVRNTIPGKGNYQKSESTGS